MVIGDRLRELREVKNLSQGDIEKRTGLLRCYISRVENGHTVPAIETLEKMARALELPLYQVMYDGNKPPEAPSALSANADRQQVQQLRGKEGRYLRKLTGLLGKMKPNDRNLLLYMAQKNGTRQGLTPTVLADFIRRIRPKPPFHLHPIGETSRGNITEFLNMEREC